MRSVRNETNEVMRSVRNETNDLLFGIYLIMLFFLLVSPYVDDATLSKVVSQFVVWIVADSQ
jgi:hypothetical protein